MRLSQNHHGSVKPVKIILPGEGCYFDSDAGRCLRMASSRRLISRVRSGASVITKAELMALTPSIMNLPSPEVLSTIKIK